MANNDWPKVGDRVELIATPSGMHPDYAKYLPAGMEGTVRAKSDTICDVDFSSGYSFSIETRLLRRPYVGNTDCPVFSKGDMVKLAETPSDFPVSAIGFVEVGMIGEVTGVSGDASRVEVKFSRGSLATLARYFTLSEPAHGIVDGGTRLSVGNADDSDKNHTKTRDNDKITPGSTVKCASVQNLHIEVLGEGRTINVSAGQVVDWFDDKSSHTPTSETSRLMSVRLRQSIRRLFDLEKRLQCPGKDAPDHEHLPYIETAARITNDVLAVVDDLNSSIIETVF